MCGGGGGGGGRGDRGREITMVLMPRALTMSMCIMLYSILV